MKERLPGWRDLIATAARDLLDIQIDKHLGPAASTGRTHDKANPAAFQKTGGIVAAARPKCRIIS